MTWVTLRSRSPALTRRDIRPVPGVRRNPVLNPLDVDGRRLRPDVDTLDPVPCALRASDQLAPGAFRTRALDAEVQPCLDGLGDLLVDVPMGHGLRGLGVPVTDAPSERE